MENSYMAEAGKLVTNTEVKDFVTTIDEMGTKEVIMVKAAESIVDNALDRVLFEDTYIDEEYDIGVEAAWAGIVQRPVNRFRLLQYPITTFTSLKGVTDRDVTTGDVTGFTTLNKNEYFVKFSDGVVTLFQTTFSSSDRIWPSFINANSLLSFPAGTARLLATYKAGYTEENVPRDLKLLILQIVSRYHRLVKDNNFNVNTVESSFGVTSLLRTMLTPEERIILNSYKRPVFA